MGSFTGAPDYPGGAGDGYGEGEPKAGVEPYQALLHPSRNLPGSLAGVQRSAAPGSHLI